MAIISYGAVAIHLSLSFIPSFFTSFTFWSGSEQAFYLNYKKMKMKIYLIWFLNNFNNRKKIVGKAAHIFHSFTTQHTIREC